MVNQISITGTNGDTIEFGSDGFILETGLRGFGVPAPVLRIDKSAADGGVFRYSKRDIREIDFPIVVVADSSDELEANLRRLSNIFKGAITLKVTYESGVAYELICYYNGGAETTRGEDASDLHARWVVILQAPQPFWTRSVPEQFSVTANAGGARGLLSAATGFKSLTRLLVKTSQALGSITVQNNGDVPAPVVWQIKGPTTSVAITLGGVGFTYSETTAIGDTITIDTEAGTVVNQNGTNKYAFLAAAPKLFSIPSGISTVSITATGSDTTNTKISGFYSPRFEVIH